MFRLFRIVVEIPALDRFTDWLEASQQKEVDNLTARLTKANAALKAATKKENTTHA